MTNPVFYSKVIPQWCDEVHCPTCGEEISGSSKNGTGWIKLNHICKISKFSEELEKILEI